jgi:hypothetical protein
MTLKQSVKAELMVRSVFTDSLKEFCDSLILLLEGLGPEDNYTIAAIEFD